MSREQDAGIPAFLAKRGITEVTDNVPDGYRVAAPSLPFVTLFGDELRAYLKRRAASMAATGEGDG